MERERALTYEGRLELRAAIDQARRSRLRRTRETEPPVIRHGTIRGYYGLGCRCDLCAAARKVYDADRRAKRKQAA